MDLVAQRSAALQKMRFFDTAVSDIDLAVTSGYPESKVFKLHERKAECLEAMARPDEAAESYRVVRRCSM